MTSDTTPFEVDEDTPALADVLDELRVRAEQLSAVVDDLAELRHAATDDTRRRDVLADAQDDVAQAWARVQLTYDRLRGELGGVA